MHLADRLDLPSGLTARPYAGPSDHAAMAPLLTAYRQVSLGEPEMATVEMLDQSYANLVGCDPALDIALVEDGGELIAYLRPAHTRLDTGVLDLVAFAPIHPDRLEPTLFHRIMDAEEAHLLKWLDSGNGSAAADNRAAGPARYRGYAGHPGPGEPPTGEAALFEERGYVTTEWSASLRRPHLDDIPDPPLPDGIEVRPVTPEQVRPIVEAHHEAFRGEWDFAEATEADYAWIIDMPHRDESLWQVAWDGDTVVGQVKPFINAEENAAQGYLRGYTEFISTHADYRGRGIAKALLVRALKAIRDRGMTEAVLGVDTNNPGGAFQLYTGLGFEPERHSVVYTKPAPGPAD